MTGVALLVGALAGLHAASWGAYKDSRFEKFQASKFLRSVALAIAAAVPVSLLLRHQRANGLLLVIGLTYATERLLTEWWKAIVREDDQDAYTIPMRLAVHGHTVETRAVRYAVGLGLLLGLLVAVVAVTWAQARSPEPPAAVLIAIAGSSGWLTAVGGAWKDAPVEGFLLAKFFRSPVVATAWACVLFSFTDQLAVLAVASGGLSVATIETYKTFLAGGAPGKFGDKQIRFAAEGVRSSCRALHGSIYALMTLVLTAGLLDAAFPTDGRPREDLALALLPALLLCCGFSFVVLARRPGVD